MTAIITKKEVYFYKRKGIRFWITILILKIKREIYEVVDNV